MKFLIVFAVLLVLVAVVVARTRSVPTSRRPRRGSRRDGGTDAGPAYWAGDGGASYGDGRDRDSGGWDGGADGGSDGGSGGGSDGGGGGGGGD